MPPIQQKKAHISCISDATSDIQLGIWEPRHQARDRSPCHPPATERTCHISIRHLPLQSHSPPLSTRRVPTVEHRSTQLIDVGVRASGSCIAASDTDRLSREL